MPKSKQESEASLAQVISSKTKHHEHLMTACDRVQEEQVDIEVAVKGEEGTSTKKQDNNQIIEDTTRLEKLVNDNYVRSGDNNDNNEQNEAPNLVPSCEKEAEYTMNEDNESVCTVQISELVEKDACVKIDEALECERSLRLFFAMNTYLQ